MLLITANWIKTVGTGVRKGGMIMFVKQLSVFMENREGRLEQAAEVGLLSAEELWAAKRLALERYRPATVWE